MSLADSKNETTDADLLSWIGRHISTEDEITLPAVRRIAATFDMEPSRFQHGDILPFHWYSMFFTANAPRSKLGDDGHPQKGDFLPPISLPRRMFVGRKVEFLQPLHVGDHADKRSEIHAIQPKSGRSGRLVFLTVRHTISVAGDPCIIEDQEVVYREAVSSKAGGSAAPASLPPADPQWSEQDVMDPALVFRYSAVTWNAHRIHYDAEYARTQEGYPKCVMNGALTVHLLIDSALRHHGGVLRLLNARLVKPLYVGDVLTLSGKSISATDIEAWATNEVGEVAALVQMQLSRID